MGSSNRPDSEVLVKETGKHEGPSAKRETGFHILVVPNETRPRILELVMVILATGREERPDSGAPCSHTLHPSGDEIPKPMSETLGLRP